MRANFKSFGQLFQELTKFKWQYCAMVRNFIVFSLHSILVLYAFGNFYADFFEIFGYRQQIKFYMTC